MSRMFAGAMAGHLRPPVIHWYPAGLIIQPGEELPLIMVPPLYKLLIMDRYQE